MTPPSKDRFQKQETVTFPPLYNMSLKRAHIFSKKFVVENNVLYQVRQLWDESPFFSFDHPTKRPNADFISGDEFENFADNSGISSADLSGSDYEYVNDQVMETEAFDAHTVNRISDHIIRKPASKRRQVAGKRRRKT